MDFEDYIMESHQASKAPHSTLSISHECYGDYRGRICEDHSRLSGVHFQRPLETKRLKDFPKLQRF